MTSSASSVNSRKTSRCARTRSCKQVLDKANRVIKQVAETDKYDLILQEAVYINPKHDITDKVLSGLNSAK